MIKNLSTKNWILLILVTILVCFLSVYIEDNKEALEQVLKTFSLTPEIAKEVLIFAVLFYIIIGLVADYLVSPFFLLTQERQELTRKKQQKAYSLSQEIEKLSNEFQKHINEEKRSAMTQKAVILSKARSEAEDIIFKTENEISSEIAKAKSNIDTKANEYLQELQEMKSELSSQIKEKILNV